MIDYDVHDWRAHLLDVRGSLVREITVRVLACVAWSGAVVAMQKWWRHVGIPETPHSLIGVAMGLLLVFRTNASYDRFWEGRKLWGSIVNDSRNLVRASSVLLASDPEALHGLVNWTIAYAWATMHHLRGEQSLGNVAPLLPPARVREVLATRHVPLAASQEMTFELNEARQRGNLSDFAHLELDRYIRSLVECLGGCERIHRTPLPFAYMVHLRRVLVLYCFTLPFALVDTMGWLTIPATLLVSYVLFGIEEIGVEIEDPFSRDPFGLPLESFCRTIEGNLRDLRGDPSVEHAPDQRMS